MADSVTIARPYAKAIFEHALQVDNLRDWSMYLHALTLAVLDPDCAAFIKNPEATIEQKTDVLFSVVKADANHKAALIELLNTLAANKRLIILPEILNRFEALRSEQEKTLEVQVTSFSKLSLEQTEQLSESLGKRLHRKITLNVDIDESLLGGAVIKAGDLVIDGSVRGKLDKLKSGLAA